MTLLLAFEGETCDRQVGRAAGKQDDDGMCRSPAVVGWAVAEAELFGEDPDDAAAGPFDDAGPLERVGEYRVAWMGRRDEKVVDRDPGREAPGVGDLKLVVAPLHVDGAAGGEVPRNRVGTPWSWLWSVVVVLAAVTDHTQNYTSLVVGTVSM